MKIAFFHELPYGGARRAVLEFGKAMGSEHQVDIFYIDEKKEEKVEKIFNKSKFYKFTPRKWSGGDWKSKLHKDTIELVKLYKIHKEIAKNIDQKDYDFVFVHGSKFTQAPFILRLLKTKSIYYCQEPLRMVYEDLFDIPVDLSIGKKIYERINRNNRRLIDKYCAKKANILLANSRFTKMNIKSWLGLDSVVAYMGIDPKRFYPEKVKKEFDLLFVGSREEIDGYSFFVRSLDNMKKKPSVRWLLREDEWIDDDSKLRDIYSKSKILVCTAYKEPFGLLPIEAQACGLAVVAVKEGGYLDTVENDKTGILFKRNEKVLAETLSEILKDTKKVDEFSKNAIENIKNNWTWDINSKKIIEIANS